MYIAQIPFFPAVKQTYELDELDANRETILAHYPEIARCVSCNTCTKSCPQELDTMDYIQAALRGDIERAAHLSFDCIMCGLCAARCPAEIVHYNVGILARRLYGKYLTKRSKWLDERVQECKTGDFDNTLDELMSLDKDDLVERYFSRERNLEIT
jgi:Na+-translocating ferredoxin:NAD+ oxidoreductase RnfC subunit